MSNTQGPANAAPKSGVSKMIGWMLQRLNEPSTWAGIGAAATAIGVALQSHTGLGAAVIAGVLAMVKAEK